LSHRILGGRSLLENAVNNLGAGTKQRDNFLKTFDRKNIDEVPLTKLDRTRLIRIRACRSQAESVSWVCIV
jgi:hypothetical protein